MDDFITPNLFNSIWNGDIDPRWIADDGYQAERVRLILWLLREAPRRNDTWEIGTVGAKAIRGWDPQAPRNDASVRRLLKEIGGGEHPSKWLFNVDRYNHPRAKWTGRGGQYATAVSKIRLPKSIWEAGEYELDHGAEDRLVHAITGTAFDVRRDRPRIIDRAVHAAAARRPKDLPTDTAKLLDYLHSRSIRTLSTRVDKARPRLIEHARARFRQTRRDNLGLIRALRLQPLPVYTGSDRTQRVVPCGFGLASAPKWMRREVFQDCFEVDMASAQLALISALWDAPQVRASLASGQSYWDALAEWIHAEFPDGQFDPATDFERLKGLLKTTTYGIAFGMTEKNVARWGNPYRLPQTEKRKRTRERAFLRRAFGEPADRIGTRLLAHPLIAELLACRDAELSRIEADGFATDVYSRSYTIGEIRGGREVTARSALAGVVQSAEHRVMLGAAAVFMAEAGRVSLKPRAYPEAEILLWQYDGFTFRVRQKGRGERWIRRANDGLQLACRSLEREIGCPQIHTHLQVDYRPANQ